MIKAMFKTIAIIVCSYICLQSYYLRGIYVGFNYSPLCEAPGSLQNKGANLYQVSPYYQFPDFHFYISFLLLLFIIGQLIKKEILSQVFSLMAISLALLGFIHIYNLKSNYVSDGDKYMDLMRLTLSMDSDHIWLTLAILIYQIIITFYYWLYERRKDSTTINGFI